MPQKSSKLTPRIKTLAKKTDKLAVNTGQGYINLSSSSCFTDIHEDPVLRIATTIRKHISVTVEPFKEQLEDLLKQPLSNQEKTEVKRLQEKTQKIISLGKAIFNMALADTNIITTKQ